MRRGIFLLFFFTNLIFALQKPLTPQNCKKRLRVLIVDGYSTGAHLSPTLQREDVDVYHMHSAEKAPKDLAASFHPKDYVESYSPKSYEEALAIARGLGLDAVMVGTESGVELNAKLNADLGFAKTVDPKILRARRDKYWMSQVLKRLGIRAVKQRKTLDVEVALNWVKKNKLWPGVVVLKPPESAGADNVYFCKNEKEFRKAFAKILKNKNLFDLKNDAVLVQEYLDGPEYVVNTASHDGHHKITDIWLYFKNQTADGRRLYGHDLLLDSRGQVQNKLVAYAKEVLEALQVETGWGHIEIIMTKDGPVLVEIGNRMMGANQPLVVAKALGVGQIEAGIAAHFAHIDPAKFYDLPDLYTLTQGAAVVTLNCYYSKARFNAAIIEKIKALPGYISHTLDYKNGQLVKRSSDLLSAIGHVELVHADPEILQQSIKQLEEWTRDGSFYLPNNPE